MVRGVSGHCVALVKHFEGFRSRPYTDAVGVWTIGYGHTRGVGPHSRALTEHQAAQLLRRDLDRNYFPAVRALPTFEHLTQRQVDALVDFVYNVGPDGIATSSHVGFALRARQWHLAANHLLDWDMAGGHHLLGLTRRRRAERRMFLRGTR